MTFKDFFSFRKNRFFWINIIAMVVVVAALLLGIFQWLDSYTLHDKAIIVPNVKGLSLKDAITKLEQTGLQWEVADSTYVKSQPAGCVLEQTPKRAQKAKLGRIIYLTLNTASVPLKTIPPVADNSSLRQAEAQLLAAGFKLTDPKWIAGESDWVYGVEYVGQETAIGQRVPEGSTLTLVVGNGSRALPVDSLATDSLEMLDNDTINDDTNWF